MLYVVLLVTRTHQAVVYEMPTAAAPEKAMANRRKLRDSGGLYIARKVSNREEPRIILDLQVVSQVVLAPVLNQDGKHCEDGDAQQVVVEHGVPIREPSRLDLLAHRQNLREMKSIRSSHFLGVFCAETRKYH